MKKYLLVVILSVFSYATFCQNISPKQAGEIAGIFIRSNTPKQFHPDIADTLITSKNGIGVYYTFLLKNTGFIIISASASGNPVLAYSFDMKFDKDNIPSNVAYWLDQYATQIYNRLVSKTSSSFYIPHNEQYKEQNTKSITSSVTPLCTTLWDQGCYYNEFCPSDNFGPCNHAATGCVATAMAQIMKFWDYPEHGADTHSYVHLIYGYLFADFGATHYQWASMADSLGTSNPAVATLMSHCGISVNMDYGSTSSGAYVSPNPFKNNFRYSQNASTIYKYNFDSVSWIQKLKTELDEGRPILYAGYPPPPMPTGHAWVCDGYDTNDFFHFNWGWSGTFNGYFQMSNFVYSLNNMAIVGIMPVQNCDITVKGLVTPVTSTFTGFEPIKVKIANYDTVPHSQIPVFYSVDNGPIVGDIVMDTIPPLGEKEFTFTQPYNFSAQPGHIYQLKVFTSLTCDAYRGNDTMTFPIQNVECSNPPYTMGFEPNESLAGWKIEDANGDGNTWYYGTVGGHNGPWCAYVVPPVQQADDWLVSKCISLETGKLYRLSFWYEAGGPPVPLDLKVLMGTTNAISSLNTLISSTLTNASSSYQLSESWFTVPLTGSYYFGWHSNNGPGSPSPVIDDISIDKLEALDVGIENFTSPSDGCDLQMEAVSVTVKNYCSTVISNIPIRYSIDGGTPQQDIIAGPIPIGGSINFTFSVLADLSSAGIHSIKVYTSYNGDTLNHNDTIEYSVTNHHSALLPYSMGFETIEDYSEWTIEDVNTDGYTWSVIPSGGNVGPACARYYYSSWIPANDWIITKCIHLLADKTYRLKFWRKIEDPTWPENMGVYLGTSASSSEMNTLILDLPGLTNTAWMQSQAFITAPSDGYYYIGWKCYSDALMFNLYLDDIYLEEYPTGIAIPEISQSVIVYPNPGNGKFMIKDLDQDGDVKDFEVFNTMGKSIHAGKIHGIINEIDLSAESSGIYLLKITSQKGISAVRLLKR